MRHAESPVQTGAGQRLYIQRWQADVPSRSVIATVHGFGEHSGRYMNLVDNLVPRCHALSSTDLRGLGAPVLRFLAALFLPPESEDFRTAPRRRGGCGITKRIRLYMARTALPD